jgi:hypothetical protein
MCEVGLRQGNHDGPLSCIPSSIQLQARFNPNELNMQSSFPGKCHRRALGWSFGKQVLLCFFFFKKALPSPSSTWMLKLVMIFMVLLRRS